MRLGMMVRILVSGLFGATSMAVAQATQSPDRNLGTVNDWALIGAAFILAAIAQAMSGYVQNQRTTPLMRLAVAGVTGAVAVGATLATMNLDVSWNQALGTAVAIGLLGPEAANWFLKRAGLPEIPKFKAPDEKVPPADDTPTPDGEDTK